MADVELDCRNLSCPLPLVQISQAVRQMETGQTLAVQATDPAFLADLRAWAEVAGHELLDCTEGPVLRAVLRKGAAQGVSA